MKVAVIFLACVAFAHSQTLPDNLLVGFATASYQVEGAWNESGKGENVWDRNTHTIPNYIDDNSNGDVACDQYHKYAEDVQLLKQLGAQVYRLSLSWSRILPNGQLPNINQDGINYYNNLINALLDNGIQPMVTLFHWDLPQRLQDLGGWPNPLMADFYEDYARLAFESFGDRVKYWITFNEPLETCKSSYGQGGGAPGIDMPGVAEYLCTHTLLKAHARAYHVYNDEFRPQQNGMIGITLNGGWVEPNSDSQADRDASEVSMLFQVGWFADPIFIGDYPAIMRSRVDENSRNEGRPRSRLPTFTPEEVNFIKGTTDFFGMNHYTTSLAVPADQLHGPDPSWERDQRVTTFSDPAWPESASDWLKVVPWGVRSQLNWVKNRYNNPIVFITESGFSDRGGTEDNDRINYYHDYLAEIINAAVQDGCNVQAYTAWSFLDNFEWRRGYTERFGVVAVDFNNPSRPRTLKKSATWFQQLLTTRVLPPRA